MTLHGTDALAHDRLRDGPKMALRYVPVRYVSVDGRTVGCGHVGASSDK